ncbi:MAG: hypothetical protein ACYC91_05090 [Solirubrobacteraceae bacterium]
MAVESPDAAPRWPDSAARIVDATLLPKLGGGILRLVLAISMIVFGGLLAMLAVIWALADYVFGFEHVWASFAVVAGVLLIAGAYFARSALARARAGDRRSQRQRCGRPERSEKRCDRELAKNCRGG